MKDCCLAMPAHPWLVVYHLSWENFRFLLLVEDIFFSDLFLNLLISSVAAVEYHIRHSKAFSPASLVAQRQRTHLPVPQMQETQVRSLGPEDPLDPLHLLWQPVLVFCLENPMDRGAWWAIVMGLHRVIHY